MIADLVQDIAGDDAAIRTHEMTHRFGSERALDAVDLSVPEGSVYVLVGANGAGKTTMLRALLGLLRPDRGRAEIFAGPPSATARAHIGYVPDRVDFGYGGLRVGELFEHHAAYFAGWDKGYADDLVGRLDVRRERRFGKLSKGQARRVQLILALAHRPRLLLLDEPTDGLDPIAREQVASLLAEHLAETPTTVLVATHLVHETEGLGDCLGALSGGRLIAQLRRDDLDRHMVRVRAEVAEGWNDAGLADLALRRRGHRREIDWVMWGEADDVASRFRAAGATPRQLARLSLEEAAQAVLWHAETARADRSRGEVGR